MIENAYICFMSLCEGFHYSTVTNRYGWDGRWQSCPYVIMYTCAWPKIIEKNRKLLLHLFSCWWEYVVASLQTDHGCIHHFDVVRRKVRSRTISQQEGSCWPQARRQGLGSSDWWPCWLHRHRHSCLWRSRTHHRCRNRPWPQGHQRHVILKFVGITCKERSYH